MDPTRDTWKLAVNCRSGSLCIITASCLVKGLHREIQDLSDDDVNMMGKEIKYSAYDENQDIYCDKCDKYYRPYCRLHPLFKIPDRELKLDEATHVPLSQQTLPILFHIEESKLPNAGLGVIADVFIPVGMVFGPYKGQTVQKKSEFYKDGYAWQVDSSDGTYYIDGSDPENSNWMRYINSPRRQDDQNMLAFQTNGKIFYRVVKPITIDEELTVWYGASFGGEFVEQKPKKKKKPLRNAFIF